MISMANLQEFHLSKAQITELVRYMDIDEKTKEKLKKKDIRLSPENFKPIEKMKSKKLNVKRIKLENDVKFTLPVNSVKHSPSTLRRNPGHHGFLRTVLGCFGCCDEHEKERSTRIRLDQDVGRWTGKHCRTREEFFEMMNFITKTVLGTCKGLKVAKEYLGYRNEPSISTVESSSFQTQGLSRIGGTMWLLAFAIQHLIDPEKKYHNLSSDMVKIRAQFQEIGLYSQQFVNIGEAFLFKVDEMREISVAIIKRLLEVDIIQENPFNIRPEIHPRKRRVRRRIDYDDNEPAGESDDEGTFHVHWTPLNVVIRHEETESWENFTHLSIEEKLAIFKTFTDSGLNFIEDATKKFNSAISPMNNLVTETRKHAMTNTPTHVTSAMYGFVMSKRSDDDPKPEELDLIKCQKLVDEFWIVIDQLYDIAYEVNLLIQESRDVVRTCYVYTTNFYHWKLSDFSDFDPAAKTHEYKANLRKAHFFIAKLLGHQRYSDAALFLSLADFSSSIYQDVLRHHAIETKGMSMKLDSSCAFEDLDAESWGLIPERGDNNEMHK